MSTSVIISVLAIALYLASAFLLGRRVTAGTASETTGQMPALLIALLGLVLHAVVLYQDTISSQGLNLGFFNVISLVGWLIVLVLVIGTLFEPVLNLGIAMFPGAALTILMSMLFNGERLIHLSGGWPMKAHIVLSFLAYSLFALATVQAVLLAIQDRSLRHHKPGGFIRALPPLQTMEALLFQMILLGFLLLSLALLTGAIFVIDISAQHLAHKTILSVVSWLVFGTLLWGRWRHGWRGRKAIVWTLGGFVALLLAYFGSKYILEIILGRSWS